LIQITTQQQSELLQFCVDNRIQAMGLMPLAGGRILEDDVVAYCAKETDVSPVQVLQLNALFVAAKSQVCCRIVLRRRYCAGVCRCEVTIWSAYRSFKSGFW
jgi:hypothetical protein